MKTLLTSLVILSGICTTAYGQLKKRLMIPVLLFLGQVCLAQVPAGWTKEQWTEAVANKGSKLLLYADKDMLEASESCMLKIQLIKVPDADPTNETPSLQKEYQYLDLPSGEVNPYTVTNWRIIDGGGNIIGIDKNTVTYTAPKSKPAAGSMTISVDLVPNSPDLPKVQLLKKLFFVRNETAFTLNIPVIGIVNARFTTTGNGGVGAMAKGNVPQMAYDAAKSRGYDLNALTSNAMYIYNPAENSSAITFSALSLEGMDGESKEVVPNAAILALAYKGKGVGSFPLTVEKQGEQVGVIMTFMQKGCGCSRDAYDNNDTYNCTGKVTITKDDGKTVEGKFNTVIFSDDGAGHIVRGRLQGRFSARKAN